MPSRDTHRSAPRADRLILRGWRESDLSPFAAANADSRVMEFFPKCLSRAESDKLAVGINENLKRHGFGVWAVEVIGGAEFIGFVGLNVPDFEAHFTPCIEIVWRLAFEHWGHGYATEAARSVIEFGFRDLAFPEIVSFTTVTNVRSQRVMKRLGMTRSVEEDFDHPNLPVGHPLRRHVLYRVSRKTTTES